MSISDAIFADPKRLNLIFKMTGAESCLAEICRSLPGEIDIPSLRYNACSDIIINCHAGVDLIISRFLLGPKTISGGSGEGDLCKEYAQGAIKTVEMMKEIVIEGKFIILNKHYPIISAMAIKAYPGDKHAQHSFCLGGEYAMRTFFPRLF